MLEEEPQTECYLMVRAVTEEQEKPGHQLPDLSSQNAELFFGKARPEPCPVVELSCSLRDREKEP